jgi:hypothetical protein
MLTHALVLHIANCWLQQQEVLHWCLDSKQFLQQGITDQYSYFECKWLRNEAVAVERATRKFVSHYCPLLLSAECTAEQRGLAASAEVLSKRDVIFRSCWDSSFSDELLQVRVSIICCMLWWLYAHKCAGECSSHLLLHCTDFVAYSTVLYWLPMSAFQSGTAQQCAAQWCSQQ